MRLVTRTLTGVVLAMATAVLPAPAHSVPPPESSAALGDGSILIAPPDGIARGYCIDIDWGWDFKIPPGYRWRAWLSFTSPGNPTPHLNWEGLNTSSDSLAPTGTQTSDLCLAPWLEAGRYSLMGTLYLVDSNYRETTFELPPVSFNLRKPESYTTLRVKPKSPRKGNIVRIFVTSKFESEDGTPLPVADDVILQQRKSGRWRKFAGEVKTTNAKGVAVYKVKNWKLKKVTLRAKTLPSAGEFGKSTSPTVVVKMRK